MSLARQERTESALSPREVIAVAQERATALMEIVEAKHLYTRINAKKYLEAEAWQTIVAFDDACPVTEWTREMKDKDGATCGYLARVNIVKHGEILAAGEMACGFDDFPCLGRVGIAQHRAAMSAAQTWAGAKAARMKYAWVAVLAGFDPTPAAEMDRRNDQEEPQGPDRIGTDDPLWCRDHETRWFKRGKMRGYAHPIGRSGEWCNKPTEEPNAPHGESVDEAVARMPEQGDHPADSVGPSAPPSELFGEEPHAQPAAAMPPSKDIDAFWAMVRKEGRDEPEVTGKLGMKLYTWLQSGRSLREAWAKIKEAKV